MNWLLDLLLTLIFLLVVVVATDKGFVRSIWSTVTVIGAFVIAYIFGPVLGSWICNNFVLDHVSSYAFDVVEELVEENAEQYNVSELFVTLPEEFTELIENCGADVDELASRFSFSITVTEAELYSMAQDIALPISETLSNAVGIIVVFLASVTLLLLAGLVLKLVVKMPVVHSIDSLFGFLFGLIKGFIIVWILCLFISLIVEHGFVSGSSNEVLYNITDSSYIFKFFCGLSPIDFINIKIE